MVVALVYAYASIGGKSFCGIPCNLLLNILLYVYPHLIYALSVWGHDAQVDPLRGSNFTLKLLFSQKIVCTSHNATKLYTMVAYTCHKVHIVKFLCLLSYIVQKHHILRLQSEGEISVKLPALVLSLDTMVCDKTSL